MGVPLVLPHTSLTIPARPLHNLTGYSSGFHTQFLNAATKYAALFGDPSDQSPFALRE